MDQEPHKSEVRGDAGELADGVPQAVNTDGADQPTKVDGKPAVDIANTKSSACLQSIDVNAADPQHGVRRERCMTHTFPAVCRRT